MGAPGARVRSEAELPFRAPETFNRLIRQLAATYGATLVDVQQHLADASPGGILGDELFLEHVHPNAEGYFLLANAFYLALKRAGEIGDWSRARGRAEAQRDMPITAIDRILADHAIRELQSNFPFTDTRQQVKFPPPRNEIERLAQRRHRDELDWLESMESLLQIYLHSGSTEEAAVVARLAARVHPFSSGPNLSAGILFMKLQQYHRARRYLDRSLVSDPDSPRALAALVRTNFELGDAGRALEHLALLKEVDPAHPAIPRFERRRAGAATPALSAASPPR